MEPQTSSKQASKHAKEHLLTGRGAAYELKMAKFLAPLVALLVPMVQLLCYAGE